MRAMILAAGRGTRMRPLTDALPKPLLKIGASSIIEWQIRRLAAAGIDDIVINHAWLGARIEEQLSDGRRFGVRLHYSPEVEALETLGGVVQALRLLGDQPFVLVSGDVFTEYPYENLTRVAADIAREYPRRAAHLVLAPNPPYHARGDMGLVGGRIVMTQPHFTYANIGVFHPRLFQGLARGEILKLFPWIYRFLGEQRVTGELYSGRWHNLGTPAELDHLNLVLADALALDADGKS